MSQYKRNPSAFNKENKSEVINKKMKMYQIDFFIFLEK